MLRAANHRKAPPYASGRTLPGCDWHQHYHSVIITQFAHETDYLKTGHDHYHSEALWVSSSETHPHGSTTTWTDGLERHWRFSSASAENGVMFCVLQDHMGTKNQHGNAAELADTRSHDYQPQTTRLCGERSHSDWRHQHHRLSGHGEYLIITLICILARSILTWRIFRRHPEIRPAHHLEVTRCREILLKWITSLERAYGLHSSEYSTGVR